MSVDHADLTPLLEEALGQYGASRTDLIRAAMNAWAAQPVIDRLCALPEDHYRSVDEVLDRLPPA
ncbi:DUF2795 domain-containing protein [Nocardioides mesophilus]|uniref:DUF2795 domain-containing protein n=1 Tax=Nocardioides mesophilus TaxID=433659 RepID=A0A7G9RF75_9ACTN|nr:DUF2795 domain-containing protein [Nocardioides mesophilus]QNN54250.1 DUF2795 domain-containing protein [Nocardioides mesophilus]